MDSSDDESCGKTAHITAYNFFQLFIASGTAYLSIGFWSIVNVQFD